MNVKPFKNEPGNRKEQVREMFDRIAGDYDFLNHLLSFNIDKRWREKLHSLIHEELTHLRHRTETVKILDVATGTGDLAFVLAQLDNVSIVGLDISEEMIKQAKMKSAKNGSPVRFIVGDSEKLMFEDDTFDFVTVAFGVRNFEDLNTGLKEFLRVLKPGGKVYILEFSTPGKGIFGSLYRLYSRRLLPRIASSFTNEPRAYSYLPESISAFPSGEEMLLEMKKSGFTGLSRNILSRGISTIYIGENGNR